MPYCLELANGHSTWQATDNIQGVLIPFQFKIAIIFGVLIHFAKYTTYFSEDLKIP